MAEGRVRQTESYCQSRSFGQRWWGKGCVRQTHSLFDLFLESTVAEAACTGAR